MRPIAGLILLALAVPPVAAQTTDPLGIPPVKLPPELDRVLRDYEAAWKKGDGARLAAIFTEDGMALASGSKPIVGREAIARWHTRPGGDLTLRALAWRAADTVGYIIGGFTYPGSTGPGGKFLLAIRRRPGGPWLIAADMDNSASPR